MQNELDEAKGQYRKLKKLQYNLSLAQNTQYCYGPEYGKCTPEEREKLWRTVTEREFKNNVKHDEKNNPDRNHDDAHAR